MVPQKIEGAWICYIGECWGRAPYSEPTVSGGSRPGVEQRLGVPPWRRHVEGVHPRGGAAESVEPMEAAAAGVRGGSARGGGDRGEWGGEADAGRHGHSLLGLSLAAGGLQSS
jgi:hypothetical protein